MNNKELFNIDVESNVSEENIILAPPVELFDEAKEIAQSTCSDEKFPFMLQHDSNQKEFLLSAAPALNSGLSLSLREPVSTPFALRVIWIPLVLYTIAAAIRLQGLTIMLPAERSISELSAILLRETPIMLRLAYLVTIPAATRFE